MALLSVLKATPRIQFETTSDATEFQLFLIIFFLFRITVDYVVPINGPLVAMVTELYRCAGQIPQRDGHYFHFGETNVKNKEKKQPLLFLLPK